ncbi:transglycosylase SLT domain-containing protein [Agarivorans sp. QJM3NY_25]|uniref:transglycosylase SLT domain-containing protein n=1 Tax=Agarivorans sp. QJM3NY_25 TaxID=3421430 RepID=UPI003D7D0ABC
MPQWFWQLCVFLLCSGLGFAQAGQLTPQQQAYKDVRQLQRAAKWTQAEQSLNQLKDYPLFDYLRYYQLRGQIRTVSRAEVEQFIGANSLSYLSNAMQRRFMLELARRGEWQSYLEFYPQLPNSIDLQCHYYYALYKTGDAPQAWQGAKKLWLHGRSRPKACDVLFTHWQKAVKISDQLRWQRMLLAFQARQISLLKYLGKSQSKIHQPEVKLLVKAYTQPAVVLSSGQLKISQSRSHQQIALLAIKRLARRDLAAAVGYLTRWAKPLSQSNQLYLNCERSLVRKVIGQPTPVLLKWADRQLRLHPDSHSIEQRVRLAIAQQQWAQISLWLARLPEATQRQERWRYWQARSMLALGQTELAMASFDKLSVERSYHGFLAAQYLNKPFQLQEQQHRMSAAELKQIDQHPVVLKVKELLALEEYYSARSEWDHLLRRSKLSRQLDLGALALSHNWQDMAVQASIIAKQWDQLQMRFPLSFAQEFEYFANKRQVEASLLYALARQESAMYPLAQSSVGARGLMQLMPATAKHTAKKIGFKYRSRSQLFEPEDNIRLGSAYLDSLLDRYQGNRILAAAAYNAGPTRVSRWLAKSGKVPADVWIESIPFKETRHYVQSVLAYQVVYQYRRKQPLQSLLTPQELSYSYGVPKG